MTSASAGYYQAEVADGAEDYYRRGGEAPGEWLGTGTEHLDAIAVGGEVSKAEHASLFEELRVGDQALGEPTSSRFVVKTRFDVDAGRSVPVLDADGDPVRIEQHPVTALDLTFSAPKSVSVAWAVGDQALGEQLWAAHRAAVEAAFGYLEGHGCYTRTGKGGTEVVDGAGFVAARYDHRASRNMDPQMHSHVLVANRVLRGDGQWRAVDGRAVFAQAKTVGMVYQAGLRAEIEATTGLRFGPVDANGQAELVSIDPAVVEVFSSRAAEIDAAMDQWRAGWAQTHDGEAPDAATSRAMAGQLALGTRTAKPAGEHSTLELQERWRSQLVERGIDPDTVIGPTVPGHTRPGTVDTATVGGQVASTVAVFSRDDVARAAARHAIGNTAAEVVADVERITAGVLTESVTIAPVDGVSVRSSDGRPTVERPGVAIHTTTATLDMEARVLRWAEASGAARVEANDGRMGRLDDTQAAAVRQVLGDGNAVSVIVGPAGHGKTTTVEEIADTWQRNRGDVIGLAPSAQASRLLADAGIRSETIDAWLLNPTMPRDGMIIVDEAGMVGTHHLDQLRAHATAAGAKVVLVGDPEQLSAVQKAGGILADIVDAAPLPDTGLSVSELRIAHRFQNDTAATVAAGLRDRDPDVVGVLEDAGWLHGHQTADAARTAVLESAWVDHKAGVETVMLVGTRADAAALNQQWQARRVTVGELDPGSRHPRTGYMDGEVIVAKQNRRDIEWDAPGGESEWLRNGTRVTVEHQGADGSILGRTADGGRVMIDGDYVKTHTQLGYARTIHSAQGATVDTAHVLLSRSTEAHGLYVAGSRAKHSTHLHAAMPADTIAEHGPGSVNGPEWSAGDAVLGAMGQVDSRSRSAHRQLREHRAEQAETITTRYQGVTPPAYPDPAERERLADLIETTGRHGTELADTQVRALGRQLDDWTTQQESAAQFDLQPGAVDYRNQFEQTQAEQELAVDYGNNIAAMDAMATELPDYVFPPVGIDGPPPPSWGMSL